MIIIDNDNYDITKIMIMIKGASVKVLASPWQQLTGSLTLCSPQTFMWLVFDDVDTLDDNEDHTYNDNDDDDGGGNDDDDDDEDAVCGDDHADIVRWSFAGWGVEGGE